MEIKKDYSVYELYCSAWGGAEDTLEKIMHYDLEDEFESLFYETFEYYLDKRIPDLTEVNDWLRFDWEIIFKQLGIDKLEEEENEED